MTDQIPPELAARYWLWVGRAGGQGRMPMGRVLNALSRAEAIFTELGQQRRVHACKRARAEALVATNQRQSAHAALAEAQAMEGVGWPLADRMRWLRVQALLHSAEGRHQHALETAHLALDMAQTGGIERYVRLLQYDIGNAYLQMGDAERAAREFCKVAALAPQRFSQGLTLARALGGLLTASLLAPDLKQTTPEWLQAQGLENLSQPKQVALYALPLLRRSGLLFLHCDLFAWLAALQGRDLAAARLIGTADGAYRFSSIVRDAVRQRARDEAVALIRNTDRPLIQQAMALGAEASEDDVNALIATICSEPGD